MRLATFVATLSLVSSFNAQQQQRPLSDPHHLSFSHTLDHAQAVPIDSSRPLSSLSNTKDRTLVFGSVDSSAYSSSLEVPSRVTIRTRPMRVRRPRSQAQFHAHREMSRRGHEPIGQLDWDDDVVPGPDYEDRLTLLELAKMTGNAYSAGRDQKNWYPIDDKWNTSTPFGWEVDDDGFRGHVFASADNSTVILSIKGTTLTFGGPTAKKDKLNDNRLFSCCCGYVDWSWHLDTVCNCYSTGYRCDNTCVREALLEDDIFYTSGINLYNNITYLYPRANIWIVGHSLGGALSSLLGATFGAPVVAFEAPGERMAAKRLHLPMPPPSPDFPVSTYHVYNTADPIPQGACTGLSSLCKHGGYALETRCHMGKSIVYDTVTKKGWRVSVASHVIKTVITNVLNEDWEDVEAGGRAVPIAVDEDDCTECYKWEYDDRVAKHPQSTTTSTATETS